MALTSGERSALWRKRQREDQGKHDEYKKKERERYKRRKGQGLVKPVTDMTKREHRLQKKRWRVNQQNKRKSDRSILKAVQNTLSPPTSPEHMEMPQPNVDGRKTAGRKKVRKDKAKCYRDIFQLRIKLDNERRYKNRYKTRYYRLLKKSPAVRNTKRGEIDHCTKVYEMIVSGIKERYKATSSHKERRMIKQLIFREKMLKKYSLCGYASKMTGIRMRRRDLKQKKQTKTSKIKLKLKEAVVRYFERDDNSRFKAGKKATITRHGEKKQIRLLNDSIKVIHKKFQFEENSKISYSFFCKLKPFWVIRATEKDRETCLCKLHENPKFKINRLYSEKVISTDNINMLLESITCCTKNRECMYRECNQCKGKSFPTKNVDGKIVEWYMWTSKRVTREKINEDGKTVQSQHTMTVKELESGTLETLVNDLQLDLERLGRHVFNINAQYESLKNMKENLTDDSVILHIDFSENYGCKYEAEIQSTHFGCSKRQISLHTGVAYTKEKTIPFTTVSDCLRHGPNGIWAHLDPVIIYLRSIKPYKHIHFVSDGPTTQYRSKTIFFLFSKKIYEYGFEDGTWNFWEAGHGKGAPDGIGAVLKRRADEMVNTNRRDIMKASDIVEGLSEIGTTVKLFEVSEEKMTEIEQEIPTKIKLVRNTMKLHQVTTTEKFKISARILSCTQCVGLKCTCYNPEETCFANEVLQDTDASTGVPVECPRLENSSADTSSEKTTLLMPVSNVDESLVGQYCMVLYIYDGMTYPGIILAVDEDEVEVKVMHRIGRNRWFWPLRDDVTWYHRKYIITLLTEEPALVTKRHHKINDDVWAMVESAVGDMNIDVMRQNVIE